jgi:hypothetical protein
MKHLSNDELIHQTRQAAGGERKATTRVIEYLEEIQRRHLYIEKKYPTLHAFCVGELGYSEAAASRRIAAMRVVHDVPEAKEMHEAGELSLETMQMVQSHARREELSLDEKKALIQQVQGLSQEQAREVVNPEKTYQITLSEEEYELLRQLKQRLATSKMGVIFKEALKRIPDRTGEPVKDSKTRKSTASLSRALYQDPECAVLECKETRHLQKDHKIEWSEGGKTTLENMQLICRPHNQMKSFKKIRPYLKQ